MPLLCVNAACVCKMADFYKTVFVFCRRMNLGWFFYLDCKQRTMYNVQRTGCIHSSELHSLSVIGALGMVTWERSGSSDCLVIRYDKAPVTRMQEAVSSLHLPCQRQALAGIPINTRMWDSIFGLVMNKSTASARSHTDRLLRVADASTRYAGLDFLENGTSAFIVTVSQWKCQWISGSAHLSAKPFGWQSKLCWMHSTRMAAVRSLVDESVVLGCSRISVCPHCPICFLNTNSVSSSHLFNCYMNHFAFFCLQTNWISDNYFL